MTEQEKYWVWLSSIDGMGAVSFYRILNEFVDAKTACENMHEIPGRVKLSPRLRENIKACSCLGYMESLAERIEKSGLKVLTRLSQNYPKLLSEIDNPPPVLYFKGCLPDGDVKWCGMVGSRRPTKNGFMLARETAHDLAKQDVVIVSGMARGIDTACHTGALEARGRTVAVLGCGADVVYPAENARLYEQITGNGAVISEFLPGAGPQARNFPMRNRIISGLSRLLIVGEGSVKSGARITVDFALKQGRDVYVMPCDAKSYVSGLPLYLMENGAPVVNDYRDVMDDNGWDIIHEIPDRSEEGRAFTGDKGRVYKALLREEMTADEISLDTGIGMRELNMLLTVMEIEGAVEACAGGRFRVNK